MQEKIIFYVTNNMRQIEFQENKPSYSHWIGGGKLQSRDWFEGYYHVEIMGGIKEGRERKMGWGGRKG